MRTPDFSVIHASARPYGWYASYENWMREAVHPEAVEYILCVDRGGPFEDAGIVYPDDARVGWNSNGVKVVWNGLRHSCVDAWNVGAKSSTGKVLITNSDDFFAPPLWDEDLIKACPHLDGEWVWEVSTGGIADARRLMTISILTQARYARYGVIFCPEYKAMYNDVEFTEVAHRDGVVVDARHLLFKHKHPTTGEAAWDEVYARENNPENYTISEAILNRRRSEGFPY